MKYDVEIPFGKRFKGKRISQIPKKELEGYISWMESTGITPGSDLESQVANLKFCIKEFYSEREIPVSELNDSQLKEVLAQMLQHSGLKIVENHGQITVRA